MQAPDCPDSIAEQAHALILAKGVSVQLGHYAPVFGDFEFIEAVQFKDPATDGTRDPEDRVWEFVVRHAPSGRLFQQRIEWAADGSTGRSTAPVEVVAQERIVVEYVPKALAAARAD